MKAPEVLGMLAEAAGVMLYEAKKVDARKTIAKKQVFLYIYIFYFFCSFVSISFGY